jgi:hypothetical protein
MSSYLDCGQRTFRQFIPVTDFAQQALGEADGLTDGIRNFSFPDGQGRHALVSMPRGVRSLDKSELVFIISRANDETASLGLKVESFTDGDVSDKPGASDPGTLSLYTLPGGSVRTVRHVVLEATTYITVTDKWLVVRFDKAAGGTFVGNIAFVGIILSWTVNDKISRS